MAVNYFWLAWPVTSICHFQTGFENKENAGITCLLINPDGQNWDGSWYCNLSDPFRNSVNWYLVFWLLDWVLEIRGLSLPWAKFITSELAEAPALSAHCTFCLYRLLLTYVFEHMLLVECVTGARKCPSWRRSGQQVFLEAFLSMHCPSSCQLTSAFWEPYWYFEIFWMPPFMAFDRLMMAFLHRAV